MVKLNRDLKAKREEKDRKHLHLVLGLAWILKRLGAGWCGPGILGKQQTIN